MFVPCQWFLHLSGWPHHTSSCFFFLLMWETYLHSLVSLGLKVREAKQHARKWLWQRVQWLGGGWFRVRASPSEWWFGLTEEEKFKKWFWSDMMFLLAFRVKTISRDCGRRPDSSEYSSEVCTGEGGWGAVAGWGRAALSQSWMIRRWSQIPHFPAQRMSSAKPSRSPRISKSCYELLRRTSMTGQKRKDRHQIKFHLFFFFFSFLFLHFKFKFLLHSWTWFCSL